MRDKPVLSTERRTLRPFTLTDAPFVEHYAGAAEVAEHTLNIPHPYPEGLARQWISSHAGHFEAGDSAVFALVLNGEDHIFGGMGIHIDHRHNHAEIGYWLGKPYWGKGYATEAGQALLGYGFETLNLYHIHAGHFVGNPASGRVMQKLGMRFEGLRPGYMRKGDRYYDLVLYGILRDWYSTHGRSGPA